MEVSTDLNDKKQTKWIKTNGSKILVKITHSNAYDSISLHLNNDKK